MRVWRPQWKFGFTTAIVSTHTPVRVWQSWWGLWRWGRRFQLTHPWGCDVRNFITHFSSMVSTHTPVRVWLADSTAWVKLTLFQLTHPWGCDAPGVIASATRLFQLTHPWGCDFGLVWMVSDCWSFNSHTREGVTGVWVQIPLGVPSFNSHTREGVTHNFADIEATYAVSTHTPVRVWHNYMRTYYNNAKVSTHTPVRVWRYSRKV